MGLRLHELKERGLWGVVSNLRATQLGLHIRTIGHQILAVLWP